MLTLFLLVLAGGSFGVDAATETFEQDHDISSTMSLDVLNKNGSIAIEAWDETRVRVVAVKKLDADVVLKTSNGKITLHDVEIVASEISKTEIKGRIGDGGGLLTLKTSNGRIDVHSLD